MVYTQKNKHQDGYSIKKGSNRYIERQQGCSDAQERIVDKKNNSRNNNVKKNKTIENLDLLEKIQRNNSKEYEVEQKLKKGDGLAWEQDEITYIDRQIYILNNRKIKEQILQENHNLVDVGYLEQQRIMKFVKRNYWQLELKEDVKKYIQGCFKYQQNKVQYQKKSGELHLLDISQELWQEISINIIGLLPKLNEMNTIVVIANRFTKMIRLKTTTTNIFSEDIVKIYKDEIQKLHRIPRKILSDKRP